MKIFGLLIFGLMAIAPLLWVFIVIPRKTFGPLAWDEEHHAMAREVIKTRVRVDRGMIASLSGFIAKNNLISMSFGTYHFRSADASVMFIIPRHTPLHKEVEEVYARERSS